MPTLFYLTSQHYPPSRDTKSVVKSQYILWPYLKLTSHGIRHSSMKVDYFQMLYCRRPEIAHYLFECQWRRLSRANRLSIGNAASARLLSLDRLGRGSRDPADRARRCAIGRSVRRPWRHSCRNQLRRAYQIVGGRGESETRVDPGQATQFVLRNLPNGS